MSATVFGIAAAQAVLVIIAGHLGGRGLATLAAIGVGFFAANVGGEQYTFIDLLAVALAWAYVFFGVQSNTSQEKTTNPPVSKPAPTKTAPVNQSTSDFIIFIIYFLRNNRLHDPFFFNAERKLFKGCRIKNFTWLRQCSRDNKL